MKKILCILLTISLFLGLMACNDTEDTPLESEIAEGAYANLLDFFRQTIDATQLKNYWRYFYKDIDGNGTPEMCVTNGDGMQLSIYTFKNNQVELVGKESFFTATTRYFSSQNPKYPGIFMFSIGGGAEHYTYITIENDHMVIKKLWDNVYVNDDANPTAQHFVSDEEIIQESAHLYEQGEDIEELNIN